tara:strand:- start:542 stop:1036 length:495 start_codon:yes stop_codon:yes gene_type:complete
MNLEMKAIKFSEWASEETYCYQANVYLDGKPFAMVSNDGHGGCDRDYSHNKFKGDYRATMKKVDDYFKSLPNTDPCDLFPEGIEQTFEQWCHDQVCTFLYRKDLKKALKKAKVVKRKDDQGKMCLWDFNIRANSDIIKAKYPEAIILNDLPEDEALIIWRETLG